jgi:hypothetical protein
VKDWPKVPEYQDGLAGTLNNLALLRDQRGDFAAATVLFEQARAHHQAALAERPDDPALRQSYRDHLVVLTRSHVGLADYARLATTADELARFGFDPAKDSYTAAGLFCRCMTVADKDTRAACLP